MHDEPLDSAELFRRYFDFVLHFMMRLGVSPSDVEDLAQDVFIHAHRAGGYRPGAAGPKTWLARTAMGIASTHRRSVRRRRESIEADAGAEVQSCGVSPQEAAELAESLARVQRILNELDLDHRAVFVLFELEGESCDRIAAGLGIPVGTVYSRLHAARRTFLERDARLSAAEANPRRVGKEVGVRNA